MKAARRHGLSIALLLLFSFSSCTIQSSTSNHYLTAEKLWADKNYPASVSEFDRVVKEAPNSSIGLQALWRASMTRTLFLNEPDEALKGFETFIERAGNSDLAPQAEQEIGEIYFTKQQQYAKAIAFYEKLLEQKTKFSADDQSKFMYRIARGQFLLNHVKQSIEWLERLMNSFPKSTYYDRAQYDLANAWYDLGDSEKGGYQKSLNLFDDLVKRLRTKNHSLFVESLFGKASAMEELDQFDEANEILQSVLNDYPAPNVVRIRMKSIEDRKAKKKRK